MFKIAIEYSGQPRDLRECHQNHVQVIWNPNKDCQIDVFAHIWLDESGYFWESYKNRGKWESWQVPFMQENWQPKGIEFEEPKEFITEWKPDSRFPHPVNNTISMFYSLEKANDLKRKYEEENNFKYDCVVRMRSDQFFLKSVGPLQSYDMNVVNVHNEYAHTDYGINDQFAFGNSELMDKYLSVCSNLDNIVEGGAAINPETILGWNAIKYHELPITKHAFSYRLWRDVCKN